MMDIMQLLQLAPTPILTVVLWSLWKIDRRLVRVETFLAVKK